MRVLVSIIGSDQFSNVALSRSDTGILKLFLWHPTDGQAEVPGPDNSAGGRVRFALCIGANQIRACFDGGDILTLDERRPASLLRIWLGRLSLGLGNPLGGATLRHSHMPLGVDDQTLKALSGGPPVTDDEIAALIDQKITTHDNDRSAHELTLLRQQSDLADSRTGIWTVAAADGFSGADGSALGTSEVGAKAWAGVLVRSGGRLRHASNGFGSAYLNSTAKDCQVEADVYPGSAGSAGSGETALFCRLNGALNQWILVQRLGDGSLTINIQFGGVTTRLASPVYKPVVAGERLKVRLIGSRIFVLRVASGVEELIFDVTETRLINETIHGVRLNGGGSVDNFRVLSREAI